MERPGVRDGVGDEGEEEGKVGLEGRAGHSR